MKQYNFNLRPTPQDIEHLAYELQNIEYDPEVDLRKWDSPVQDQGHAGSCVSNALTNVYESMVKRQYPDRFVELSRLFVYYNSRVIEESVDMDVGIIHIKDSLDSVVNKGICSEDLWPYDLEKLTVEPSEPCYADAIKRRIVKMQHIKNVRGMIESIHDQHPVIIGMEVYNGFMKCNILHPTIPMPSLEEEFLGSLGGHAVTVVGYSIPKKRFIVKNSFGIGWGENGYCYITFDYMEKYAFERWRFDINDQTTSDV